MITLFRYVFGLCVFLFGSIGLLFAATPSLTTLTNVVMNKLEEVVLEQTSSVQQETALWLTLSTKIQGIIDKKTTTNEEFHPVLPLLVEETKQKYLSLSLASDSDSDSNSNIDANTASDSVSQQNDTLGEKQASIRKEMLGVVNTQRSNAGRSSLVSNPLLTQIAQQHADWMSQNLSCAANQLTHIQNGEGPSQRATKFGYNWGYIGENVACGQTNVDEVMDQWMASSFHKENILNPHYKEMGVGYAGDFWVQVFGTELQ